MKNTKRLIAMSMAAAMFSTTPALAGTWQGAEGSYRYQNDDGSFAAGGWHWIDGNNDGTAESYYFDPNGILLQNTTTPDNYQVDASGAWVVDGVVQTKSVGAAQAAGAEENEGAPLAHLQKYFVKNASGTLMWRYGMDYLWEIDPDSDNRWNEKYQHTGTKELIMQGALEHNDAAILLEPSPMDFIVLAELAGLEPTGHEDYIAMNRGKIDALKNEVVSFMNSFDWRNASGYEKAVAVSKKIIEAPYYDDVTYKTNDFGQQYSVTGDAYTSYGCLVKKGATCNGYVTAANLLARCIGLEASMVVIGSHGYPVYNVDGYWLAHEPATTGYKDRDFTVFDYNTDGKDGLEKQYYLPIAEYLDRKGYVTPTDEEIREKFPVTNFDSSGKIHVYFGDL